MKLQVLLIIGFSFLFFSCQKEKREISMSFYHWKSSFDLQTQELDYLQQLNTQKIYLRFFDVDWNANASEPLPIAQLDSKVENFPLEIIPTVFITNRSLKNSTSKSIPKLADNILYKIDEIAESFSLKDYKELQFDCDWTPSTQAKFFELLKVIADQKKEINLSATIRLHQIKFFEKTGVPPVDRGMLMFYNMGEVENWEEPNSILNLNTAKQYLSKMKEYPIPLDLALPIFSWGVLFRQGKMIKLINQLRQEDLTDTEKFRQKDEHKYEVIKSTYLKGYYLYTEDEIRLESVNKNQLEETVQLLDPLMKREDITLTFYHIDSDVIKHYPYEVLNSIRETLQ